MTLRSDLDPELHSLRSIIRTLDGRERTDAESARFGVYAALEAGDAPLARRWSAALRVAMLALPEDRAHLRGPALAALDTIDRALGA